jgi:hypothetical protein
LNRLYALFLLAAENGIKLARGRERRERRFIVASPLADFVDVISGVGRCTGSRPLGGKGPLSTPPRFDERRSPSAAAIVFTRYLAGSPTEFQSLSTFEALQRLTESGFWLEHERGTIASFLAWFEAMPRYGLSYSDLGEATGVIRALLPL